MGRNDKNSFMQDQNPLGAVLGGIIGVPISSAFWTEVVSIYKLEINILAIAVGFIVGYMVKILGKGNTPVYGIIGVIFTLFGCISGRIMSAMILNSGKPITLIADQVINLNTGMAVYYLESTFQISDLIFYIIALFAGYYCSFRN